MSSAQVSSGTGPADFWGPPTVFASFLGTAGADEPPLRACRGFACARLGFVLFSVHLHA